MKMEEQVFYSSFNHFSVRKMKELAPFADAGLLYADRPIGVVEYAKNVVRADALHPAIYHLTEPGYVESAHEAGLKVRVWTVDGADRIRQMQALKVDAIFTNEPDAALREVRA
jgi:glycerophosphoryl diester phosphodiesterase